MEKQKPAFIYQFLLEIYGFWKCYNFSTKHIPTVIFQYINHANASFLANIKLWYIPENKGR